MTRDRLLEVVFWTILVGLVVLSIVGGGGGADDCGRFGC